MTLPLITGVILAGGQARRMGGQDKGLVQLFNKPLYLHVAERIAPQVESLIVNANRNIEIYLQSGYPVISDSIIGFAGPLAGILAGLENAGREWVLFVPCDTPFIPLNLAELLWKQKDNADAVYAHDGEREHPTISLINKNVIPKLRQFLANGDKKLMLFLQQCNAKAVVFNGDRSAFHNLNTLDDCEKLEKNKNDEDKR